MKIKLIIAAIVAFFTAMVYREGKKSATNKIKAESEEAAREAEQLGYEAGREGLKKESEVLSEDVNTRDRTHFE